MITIDKRLNLVITVLEDDDPKRVKAYIHSTPVGYGSSRNTGT